MEQVAMLLGSRPPRVHYVMPGPGPRYVGHFVTARYVAGHRRRARPVLLRDRISDPDT